MQNATIDAPAASRTAAPTAQPTLNSATAHAQIARPARAGDSGQNVTRLMLGLAVVGVLATVALLSRPQQSVAADQNPGGAARLSPRAAASSNPGFSLDSPSTVLFDGAMLAGHTGIPVPPATDAQGRSNLGVLVGPSLFVWVYGGADGVRYTVADLTGQVLSAGLTADEVYGAFPEINIPEMQFGPDGRLCEPIMWAGEPDGLE